MEEGLIQFIPPRYIDINGNIDITQMVNVFRNLVHNKLMNGNVVQHHPRRVRRLAANNPLWNDLKNALFQEVFHAAQLRVSVNSEEVDNQIQNDAQVLMNLFRRNIWPPAVLVLNDNEEDDNEEDDNEEDH